RPPRRGSSRGSRRPARWRSNRCRGCPGASRAPAGGCSSPVEGIGGHGPTGRRGRRSREGELHRPLRGGELDPLPGLVRLLGGLHDRVARAPELVALRAPLRKELHVVLLRAHPALSEALDPVAAGRCGADAAGREQTDEGVPAALLRADGEALLDELPKVSWTRSHVALEPVHREPPERSWPG